MPELATASSSEESRLERFFNRGDSLPELTRDLDHAYSRGDIPVSQALSPLLIEIEERRGVSMALARAYLKNRSLPALEALNTLKNGREIDATLREKMDGTFVDTAEHIAVLLKERGALPTYASSYYRKVRKQLTGGITELTSFALFNHNSGLSTGSLQNFILTASSDDEDEAGFDEEGKNLGFDFRAYPINPILDLDNPVKIQMKTSDSRAEHYHQDILVAALNRLTPEPVQAFKELPYAIVHEARGTSRPKERDLMARTALNLEVKIWDHYIKHAPQDELPRPDVDPNEYMI